MHVYTFLLNVEMASCKADTYHLRLYIHTSRAGLNRDLSPRPVLKQRVFLMLDNTIEYDASACPHLTETIFMEESNSNIRIHARHI